MFDTPFCGDCEGALLRIVDSAQRMELGRQTSRRPSPVEQAPQPKLIPGKRWGTKNVRDVTEPNKQKMLRQNFQNGFASS